MNKKLYDYDISLSFAGEDREIASKLADQLQYYNIPVFFDEFMQTDLIGRDLTAYLPEIYSKRARYCVLLISNSYPKKKWAANIELPAARERIYSEGDNYIIPVLIDDTNLPGVLSTLGHLDLRRISIKEVADRIAMKVLSCRYLQNDLKIFQNKITNNFINQYDEANDKCFIDISCNVMFNSSTTEIRIATFTPVGLFKTGQFLITLDLLIEKMIKENRDGTIRFYCLSPNIDNMNKFVELSREPVSELKEKIKRGSKLISDLLTRKNLKEKIRLQIIYFSGIPPFHICQIGNHYFFRSYTFGQKQDSYTVFHVMKDNSPPSFISCLDNIFFDLERRSEINTINWF